MPRSSAVILHRAHHRLNDDGCKLLEADLSADAALNTVGSLGHEFRSLWWNVEAATDTFPVRAVRESGAEGLRLRPFRWLQICNHEGNSPKHMLAGFRHV